MKRYNYLLVVLLAIFLKTFIFYTAFNMLAPKLAEMHGQSKESFKLTFLQSFLFIVVVHTLLY